MSIFKQNHSLSSAFYLFCAVVILSLSNVIVKSIQPIPASQLILIRALFILFVTYPILLKKNISIASTHWKLLLLRGLFGTTGMFLLFYVLQKTSLATSVSLFYLSPIFTVIFAQLITREKMPWQKWPWLLCCLIGVGLIKNFSLQLNELTFWLAIAAALFAALAYNMIRLLKNKAHPLLVVFFLPLVSAPLISYWAIKEWIWPNFTQWFLIGLLCLCAYSAQILLTLAYQNASAHRITHLNYLGLPLGVLWGSLFFREFPHFWSLIGILLIFIGLIANHWLERKPLTSNR